MNEKQTTATVAFAIACASIVLIAIVFRMAGCCERIRTDEIGNRYYSEREAKKFFGQNQQPESP